MLLYFGAVVLIITISALIIYGCYQYVDEHRIQNRYAEGWEVEKSFIIPLKSSGIPKNIIHCFLNQFAEDSLETYPVLPEDNVYHIFNWEESDVEDALKYLAKEFNKKLPESEKEMDDLIIDHIKTVKDLLRVVYQLPKNS